MDSGCAKAIAVEEADIKARYGMRLAMANVHNQRIGTHPDAYGTLIVGTQQTCDYQRSLL